jgi:hypothetical protein
VNLNKRIAALRAGDDSGAALILALVFITVVAIAIAALLSLADTSLRATVALRGQAADSAAADAAAQIAINNLRHGTYVGLPGSCFGASATTTLTNFYQPQTGAADSATVSCSEDLTNSVPSINTTKPGYALMALGNNPNETGILNMTNNGGVIKTQGAVGARSNIDVFHGELRAAGNVVASACSGTITILNPPGGVQACGPAAGASIIDPNYAAPDPPTGAAPASSGCGSKAVVTFFPGLYTSVPNLNCNKAKVFDFRPGVYYFNYPGLWTISSGILVAGSANALSASPLPTIPGACQSQISTINPNPNAGVEFVFGGSSRINISFDAQVEICGIYSKTGPPIAIYGLKSAIGSGALQLPAENSCLYPYQGNQSCSLITTDQNSTNIVFYMQGLTYAPNAWVALDLRKSTNQFFNDGLVVRAFSVFAPASASPPTPLASTPTGYPGAARTIADLTVYLCPGSSTCSTATGTVRLKVKVGIGDLASAPTAGHREITVYSWSVQR